MTNILAGIGGEVAVASVAAVVKPTFTTVGSLGATANLQKVAKSQPHAVGSLITTARSIVGASANLGAAAGLRNVTGHLNALARANPPATSGAQNKANVLEAIGSSLNGSGHLQVSVRLRLLLYTALAGVGGALSDAGRDVPATISLAGTGATTVSGSHAPKAVVAFAGHGGLLPLAADYAVAVAALHANSELVSHTTSFATASAAMAGRGRCTFLLPQIHVVVLMQFDGSAAIQGHVEHWQVRPPIPAALAKPIQPYSRAA